MEFPWIVLPHGYPGALSHCPRIDSYSTGVRLHVSRIPKGVTAHPHFRAGVAFPQGNATLPGQTREDWG